MPTKDSHIMLRLRELGEPIMLFGEPPEDRRERLRDALVKAGSDRGMPLLKEEEKQSDNERYYTKGSANLLEARQWILYTSLILYFFFTF